MYRLLISICSCFFLTLPLVAAAFAYISTAGTNNNSVKVLDVATMTVVSSIVGVGDEPSRMVASPDFNRLYLASWTLPSVGIPPRGMIYAIDTRSRQVVASLAVGDMQNRALGISPDGTRLYSWKRSNNNGVLSMAFAVIDSGNLSEIASVPYPIAA